MAFDGNPETAWVEGTTDDGIGEFIEITLFALVPSPSYLGVASSVARRITEHYGAYLSSGGGEARSFATDVFVAGEHAYVIFRSSGLRIFDVSIPVLPIEIGGFGSVHAEAVFCAGDFAYKATLMCGWPNNTTMWPIVIPEC